MLRILLSLAMGLPLLAQELPQNLLEAAKRGRTKDVEAQLARGSDIEMRDREGRTPLMLAAQYGHAATVDFLVARGAKPGARDSRGWNAYMLALLAPAGGVAGMVRSAHDEVLRRLPQPPRFRLQVDAGWSQGNAIFSSCFMRPAEMAAHLREIRPDALVAEAFRRFAATSGRDLIAVVRTDARGTAELSTLTPESGLDATLDLSVQPGCTCVQGADLVSLRVRAQVMPASGGVPVLDRLFGSGVKTGMRGEYANNPNQHAPLYGAWAKAQAGNIYWAVVEALLLSQW